MKLIKFTVGCIAVTFANQPVSLAEVTRLAAEERQALQEVARFHEVRRSTDLPPCILALCADGKGRMAEPGQKWQVTDVIVHEALPGKRLIWAATDGKRYVVHYERGGIAHSFHVLIARLAQGDVRPKTVWCGVGEHFKDYPAFLTALKKGALDDRLDYAQ